MDDGLANRKSLKLANHSAAGFPALLLLIYEKGWIKISCSLCYGILSKDWNSYFVPRLERLLGS
jgi:hypothetical protein